MRTWFTINEELLELERTKPIVIDEDFKERWDKLVDESRTIVGCLIREKYDKEKIEETTRKRQNKKRVTRENV